MRIAIVNDTLIAIEALRRILVTVTDYEIAWVAYNGVEAVNKCAADTPDLILMDLFMPQMGGVEATRQIMSNSPCAIVIVTSTVGRYSSKVFEAMGYGALDAINTPILGILDNPQSGTELLAKIVTISKLLGKSPKSAGRKSQLVSKLKQEFISTSTPPLLVIGASTGGPRALAAILSQFSTNFIGAIVIVQHIDVQFASSLISWLKLQTPLPVEMAQAGSHLEAGKVVVAGTNDHLILTADLKLKYTPEPLNCPYRPSVNTFFESVAENFPNKGVAVLLTGMGRDGAEGLSSLKKAGWHTIAQDKNTSVVYGMPKAAVELDAAVEVLPIDAIASACISTLNFYNPYRTHLAKN